MEPPSTSEQAFFEELRRRRAELLESMRAVEQAVSAPAPGREERWAERVHVSLVELAADFREHVNLTEGPDGLYRELLKSAPRLSGAVARLTSEHALINADVDNLLAVASEPGIDEYDRVRELGTALLARLLRHRQHGSDLIYEAYQAEIGGET
jgi:ATP phosphoribosyltransferase regulatory subunit HisZ